jgi:hypothetical protein
MGTIVIGAAIGFDPWGTCVGEAKLCDNGTVQDDPRFTCGYACTGGRHTGPGAYIRCTDPSHYRSHCPACGQTIERLVGPAQNVYRDGFRMGGNG